MGALQASVNDPSAARAALLDCIAVMKRAIGAVPIDGSGRSASLAYTPLVQYVSRFGLPHSVRVKVSILNAVDYSSYRTCCRSGGSPVTVGGAPTVDHRKVSFLDLFSFSKYTSKVFTSTLVAIRALDTAQHSHPNALEPDPSGANVTSSVLDVRQQLTRRCRCAWGRLKVRKRKRPERTFPQPSARRQRGSGVARVIRHGTTSEPLREAVRAARAGCASHRLRRRSNR